MLRASSSILKDTAVYSGSIWVIQVTSLAVAIFIRRVLGPEAMGIWALIQVLLNYVGYGNLGMLNAVCREIPILTGAGGYERKIENIKNAGFAYIGVIGIVTSGLIVIGAILFRHRISEALFFGFLTMAAINLFQRINNYMIQLLQVEKQFTLVSKFKIYSAIVNALFVIALTWRYNLYGFFAGTILTYAFNVLCLFYYGKIRFRFVWEGKEISALLKFGIPFFVLMMASSFLTSIDKIAISQFLGLKELGIYSIAMLAGSYLTMLPTGFQVVLYPRTLEKFGNQTDIEGRKKYSILPGKIISLYFSLCIGMIWIFAPALCTWVLPKFTPGIPALKILIFGYAFLALSQQMQQVLLGYGRHLYMIPVAVILTAFVYGIGGVLAKTGGGLSVISGVMTIAMLVNYIAAALFALNPVYPFFAALQRIGETLIPLSFASFFLVLLDLFWPTQDLAQLAAQVVIYLVSWTFIVLAMEKELGMLKTLKDVILNPRQKKAESYESIRPMSSVEEEAVR